MRDGLYIGDYDLATDSFWSGAEWVERHAMEDTKWNIQARGDEPPLRIVAWPQQKDNHMCDDKFTVPVDQTIRMDCLRLAVDGSVLHHAHDTSDAATIARASAYADFVMGLTTVTEPARAYDDMPF